MSLTLSLCSRSHSSSPLSFLVLFLALCLSFFLSFSFLHRLPAAPSYPRGNPREPLPFPAAHRPSSAPTATTRVYKLNQPGSTYLPFRIIRLACRPLLHAEFRLIKMILRGLSIVSAIWESWILIRTLTKRYCLNERYLFFCSEIL